MTTERVPNFKRPCFDIDLSIKANDPSDGGILTGILTLMMVVCIGMAFYNLWPYGNLNWGAGGFAIAAVVFAVLAFFADRADSRGRSSSGN